ncbi:MAG TPA: hypothetical protein VGR02_11870 [Thermoanaerobaculia bacterium]|jgi:hypothetical protein|nr:hypothetical protein [Thermoanaerobaculia bacterium]
MHAAGILLFAASVAAVATQPDRVDLTAGEAARITRVKHEVRDAVADALRTEGDPARAQRQFTEASRVFEGVEVRFRDVEGHPELVAVTTLIDIPCGSDTSLYLFRLESDGWRLILARESNGYRRIAGALDMFQYAVSPSDANGDFFVVTANVNPWCSSNWQMLRFDVRRIGADAYSSRVLVSGNESIYLDADDYELKAGVDDVRLQWRSWQSLDLGLHNRAHVRHFSICGDRVERVGPFALAPEDFVDEWGRMPWEEASRFGGPRAVHQLLNKRRFFYSAFDPVRRGKDGAWIVPLWVERKPRNEWMTFTIEQRGDEFVIRGVDVAAADQ